MIEILGYVAGPVTGVSILVVMYYVAKAFNLQVVIAQWSGHFERCAVARKMRAEGASDKQVTRFLAEHALARAGRSP